MQEEEGEADLGRPWSEQGMYCCHYEVMPYPPPLGINGETTTFESGSTSAHGFTGAVTFSLLPIPDGRDTPSHPLRMQGATGLSRDLSNVPDGGVDAISTLVWSEIMMRPIGMADYLSEAAEEAGTLVFVFEIMFKLFMEIRHRCSDSLSVDPSRVHSNKFSVSWVHLGKLFCDTNLLPFVSCILGSSIILLLLHIQIVSH
jgi:hypothetical protein